MNTETQINNVLEHYQRFTQTTAVYPDAGKHTFLELMYLFLGFKGESQELHTELTAENVEQEKVQKEAGDVFWYISQLCNLHKWDLVQMYSGANFANYDNFVPNTFEAIKKWIRDNKNYERSLSSEITLMLGLFKSVWDEEEIINIIIKNRDKLIDRQNKGVLKGSGETIEERSQ